MQKKAKTTTAQTTPTNETRITFKCVQTVNLFDVKKNRIMNKYEQETEKAVSKAFMRPPCTYIYDKPFYPWLPIEPLVNQPYVNFDLNFQQ